MVITSKIDGDFEVSENLTLHGMIVGDVHVTNDSTFQLHGIVTGDLSVESGIVKLRGMVEKNVINLGGCVEIWGMVNGTVTTESGKTLIYEKAMISGQMIEVAIEQN